MRIKSAYREMVDTLSPANSAFVFGSLLALASLVVTSILAARWMGPNDYSTYAAFVSVVGIFALAPGMAVEQHTTRVVAAQSRLTRTSRNSIWRYAIVVTAVSLVVLIVPVHWQAAILGEANSWLLYFVAAAVLVNTVASIQRGWIAGLGLRGTFGVSMSAQAVIALVIPVLLFLIFRVQPLEAFGLGLVVSLATPCVLITLQSRRIRNFESDTYAVDERLKGTDAAALVLANLLLAISMMIIPAVLRLHVDAFGAVAVASAQILVSTSRMSTLLLGSVAAVVIQQAASSSTSGLRRVKQLTVGAAAFGLIVVIGVTLLGPALLGVLYGRQYEFTFVLALVASLSVLFLNPGQVLSSLATGTGRYRLQAVAWGIGLVILLLAAIVPQGLGLYGVLMLISAGTLATTAVLALGLRKTLFPL